jgi:hypothetical protein
MRLKRARQMQDSTKDMLAYKEIVDRALTVSERCCACGMHVLKMFLKEEKALEEAATKLLRAPKTLSSR